MIPDAAITAIERQSSIVRDDFGIPTAAVHPDRAA
jgi:hypothetical protein